MSDAKGLPKSASKPRNPATIAPAHGTVFVVSAPSGAGKTSLVRALLEQDPQVALSISHTTRAKRSGERDGVHYHFINRERFDNLRAAGEFLEYAEVHGNAYGTARQSVLEHTAQGNDVLLEIDWQGAEQVRQKMQNCVSVFIFPPTMAQLRSRLEQRGTETREDMQRRLRNAVEEISHSDSFDYWLVNDDFDMALGQLTTIVRCERLKRARSDSNMQQWVEALIAESDQIAL